MTLAVVDGAETVTRGSGVLLPLFIACSSSASPSSPPAPVKVEAAPQDLRRLAGSWLGEFPWFEGRLMRDTLTGTYFSRRTETGPIRRGTWWAARH